nr:Ig-like domain-containing protein [uncultured Faecalicatena sp.]
MRKKRNLKERVCAFVLALLLPLTSVLPDVTMVASAADPVNPSSTTVQNVSFYIYEGFTLDDGSTQEVGLSGAKITVYEDGTQIGETRATEKEGILILSDFTADSTKTYTYSVEKEGFDSETNIALDLTTQNKSELTMSPITLSKTAVGPLNPADSNNNTASIDINHRIENSSDGEPGYVWESNNKSVATVDDAGNIRAEGLGKTNITVTRHNETASVEVIVKETISGMTITANPGSNTTDNVDVSSVEISIGGMPSGAKGNVNIYKGDEKGTFIDTIQAPYDSSVAYNNPKGKTVFTAVFEENDKDFYLKSSVSTNEISYKKSSQIVLDQVSDTVTYGDAPKQITVTQASLQGRDLSYTSSNENVATVDENGSVSFKSAGTATITVTAAANDEYTESTAKYDITVDQKTLSNISLQNISWQPVEKVFDGTKEITMKGKLSHTENTDIVGDDVIEVEATAEVDSADAKSYTTCNITNITKSSDSRYDFSIDDTKKEVSSQIKITKRPVYVSIEKKTGDYETKIPYGMTKDEILTKVKADNKVVLAGTNGKIVDGAEQGMIGSDDSDLENRTEIILKDQSIMLVFMEMLFSLRLSR